MKKAVNILFVIIFCTLLIGCSKNDTNKDNIVEISLKNLHPTLYDKNGLKISIEECEYSGIQKDDIEIMLTIKNESKETVNIDLKDASIEDVNISSLFDSEEYTPGDNVSSSYYFSGEDVSAANVNDFEKINFVLYISTENKELLTQKIVIKREAFIESISDTEGDDEETEEIQDEDNADDIYESSNITFDAYNEAININDSELIKSEYRNTYHGISINYDELEWLESGAIYRSLAKKLEGFDMEISKNAYNPDSEDDISLICGHKQATWDEMKPYVDKAKMVVTAENTLYAVMISFQNLDCVTGNFDFDNNIYDFEITNLEKASNDLGISQKMLGYTLAMLDEYAPTIEFGDNTCKCTWIKLTSN